jgi:hypothetical protein
MNNAWSLIRGDDDYRQTTRPVVDDLVFYVARESGFLHVGRIVELRPGVTSESPPIPWAVSKWSDWTGEIFHSVFDHPYQHPDDDVTIQFWTDRPSQNG